MAVKIKKWFIVIAEICASLCLAGGMSFVVALGASLIEGDLVPTQEKIVWGCFLIGFVIIVFIAISILLYRKNGIKKFFLLFFLPFWLFIVPFTIWLY